MKKYFLLGLIGITSIISCQKDFLEKPDTTGATDIGSVFSIRITAEQAITAAYQEALVANLYDKVSQNGLLVAISGEQGYGPTYQTPAYYAATGFLPVPRGTGDSNILSVDQFFLNFSALRKCYIVIENIDKATDIDAAEKTWIKAEMKGLIAYRYMHMMMHYGGVPIVDKVLSAETDKLEIPRATLQKTLDFTLKNIDEAIAGLPDNWPDKFNGRLTKGTAMAIKAKALMTAARPLFNSATPYLSLGGNNNLICFGTADQQRWQAEITASEAAIAWCNANGYMLLNTGGGINIPNVNALQDYGTATSTPANKETLLAYKNDFYNSEERFFNLYNRTSGNGHKDQAGQNGVPTNFLVNWYRSDGTDQSWPAVGENRPATDYTDRMNAMEPRFKADNIAHGINSWANPGNSLWSYNNAGIRVNVVGVSTRDAGAATPSKFYYLAGSRVWFEYPLFRVAELYLNLAEAYNEVGNTAKALQNLNLVHNRGGLPSITETNQANLRKIIQREWAVEFFIENHFYFNIRQWKLDVGKDLGAGKFREIQFTVSKNADGSNKDSRVPANWVTYSDNVSYTTFWHDKMILSPIPQTEIDKGYLIQNPGY